LLALTAWEILLVSKANAFFSLNVFFLKRIVEIFGNAEECWQRLLNALQTRGVQTTLMLVTTYGLMFGIGAALTGLVLTLEEES
jgi:hypothetical protein